jgi:Cdc6-like AAA superfamily ATPase
MALSLEESDLVGRSRDKYAILQLITMGSGEFICVCGSRGIGKTTLVRNVYGCQELNERFQIRAYVKVIRPFILEELLRSLLTQLGVGKTYDDMVFLSGRTRETFLTRLLEELINVLAQLLYRMKCLIVLDDVSSIEDAKEIVQLFRNMPSSSKIIVTTREVLIAEHVSKESESRYMLNPLSYEDALDLFTRKVLKKYYHAPFFFWDF